MNAARPAAASVAPSLLLPQSRIARRALAPWARSLVERAAGFRGRFRTTRKLCGELGGVANNAGLIAAHHGDAAMARSLCERQMCFQHRYARRARDPAVVAHAIQPWVNLGRLEAILGQWESSVSRFSRLRGYRRGGRVDLDSVCVNGTAWEALSPNPRSFEQLLENIYVIDTLKALLLNRRWAEALEFVEGVAGDCPDDSVLMTREARVVALAGLGDADAAHAEAGAAASETRGWTRAVFRVRQAEVLAHDGRAEAARATLLPLAAVVRQIAPATRADLEVLHVLHRIGGLCGELGMEEDAVAVARGVYEGAGETDDEAFRIEALRVLAAGAPPEEREGWREALDAAETATDYRRYRRGGAPEPHPVLAPFFVFVHEMLAG